MHSKSFTITQTADLRLNLNLYQIFVKRVEVLHEKFFASNEPELRSELVPILD